MGREQPAAVYSGPKKNDGGSMVTFGSVTSNSPITKIITGVRKNWGYGTDFVGLANNSYNGNSGGIIIKKIVAAGELGKQRKNEYVIMRVSTKLAGISNTILRSGASIIGRGRRSIHYNTSRYTLLAVTAGWNRSTGAFLSTPTVQVNNFGRDDAAVPTSAVPGELAYKSSAFHPIQGEYHPRTLG